MPPVDQQDSIKFDPRAYIAILIFRWKIIALAILACLLGGVGYLRVAPTIWLTNCVVMIWQDPTLKMADSGSQWSNMRSYIWLLNSEDLKDVVLKTMLDDKQTNWVKEARGLRNMRNVSFSVTVDRNHGSLLDLSVKHVNRQYAAAYLNAVWNEFLKRQIEMKTKSSGDVPGILQQELNNLEDGIELAEDDLLDYTRLMAYDVASASSDMERRYLLTLLGYRNALGTEIALLDTQFPFIKEQDALVISQYRQLAERAGTLAPGGGSGKEGASAGGAATGSAGTSEKEKGVKDVLGETGEEHPLFDTPEVQQWAKMKVELAGLQARTNELSAKFTPDHPEVKAINRRIDELQEQLSQAKDMAISRLLARREALKQSWQALETPIREWNNTYQRTSAKQAGYRRKSLVVERREALYRTLYTRLQDLKISEELKADHFTVISPIKTSETPAWPDPVKIMSMALVLALGSGVGLAVLAQMLDNKMQTIVDVETVVGHPFLGGVPKWIGPVGDRVARPMVLEEHASGAIEAYRVLRTNILSSMDKAGQKMAFFTSAESKEGKTITALNIAVMTAKVGKRVLLIDMDLRRPRMHRSLQRERTPGVTEVLGGGLALGDVVVPTEVDNLWFAPSGGDCDHVAELLQSANLNSFFAEVKQQYDYIFIDTAPVLRAADVGIIAGRGLCSVVFVCRVNKTPKPLIKYAMDQLGAAHVLGVVMNHIDMSKISSIYYSYQYPNYAYYAYSYAYGYDYDHYADGLKAHGARPKRSLGSRFRSAIRHARRSLLPMD